MRRDILELDTSIASRAEELRPTLLDAEGIRMLLTGGSVIDWHKSAFADLEQVDRLLKLHLLDPDDPHDQQRLRYLFFEAIAYVEEYLQLRIPPKIRDVRDVRRLFLWASDTRGFRRNQVLSCMILKLMHVMQHLEAADLRLRTPVSEQFLLDLAHRRIATAAHRMRTSGPPLVAFYGSRKTRMSVITKLLCKREDVATTVFDKLRYRVVVPERGDVVQALVWLVRHLFPFNQVIPGQSHNNLLELDQVTAHLSADDRDLVQPLDDDLPKGDTPKNEFSGSSYRMINFVVDVPVRVPPEALPPGSSNSLGNVVYVTTEFQLVDAGTARTNEAGENAHAAYKRRQFERVRLRLTRGQYVP